MNKKEFRQKQHSILKAFSLTKQKSIQDKILTDKFLSSAILKGAQKIGITISMPEEVDTIAIIAGLLSQGKQVYIPRCLPGRKMEFTKFTSYDDLTTTKFGTREIWQDNAIIENNPDLIVVPLLAMETKERNRLGFGGGYYDRFLKDFSGKTISLLNEKQNYTQPLWPIEKFDVPIDNYIAVN